MSTQTCRNRRAVKNFKLLQISNYSAFKSGGQGEGDNYKTTSDKMRMKEKIFKLDHTK